jgi:hypothetical protein
MNEAFEYLSEMPMSVSLGYVQRGRGKGEGGRGREKWNGRGKGKGEEATSSLKLTFHRTPLAYFLKLKAKTYPVNPNLDKFTQGIFLSFQMSSHSRAGYFSPKFFFIYLGNLW